MNENEQSLSDRVAHLINVQKLSVREAAAAVGRDPQTIKKLIARDGLRLAANGDRGGRRPMTSYPILSEQHRALGIRMNNHRELTQKWNLDEMARFLGLNRLTVQRMEAGRWDFTLSQLNKIRDMLGLDLPAAIEPFKSNPASTTPNLRVS